jgi:CRISPR-associated Csh1 family protein
MKDLSKLVLHQDYDEILLTVKIGQRYLSDIDGFPELLQIAAQGEESVPPSAIASKCMVCNQQSSGDELKEPLPFFTIDKPNFIPDGMLDNSYKVFSLCRDCYIDLQKGSKYIQERLAFNIPKTMGNSKLWLWLIPQLNDPKLVQDYVHRADMGLTSFKQMLQISEGMETARDADLSHMSEKTNSTESDGRISNFLTYVALFHTYDKQKHMRLVSAVDGIYPSRLRELSLAKAAVDEISFKNGSKLKFHFGLITDFLEKDSDGWMKIMAYIMSSIFTKKPIDELLITQILLSKAKSALSNHDLHQWRQIMLNATLVLEYLYKVGSLSTTTENLESSISSYQYNEKASMAADFLNSHQSLLYTKNLRAICAIGISVGVIINAQKRYLGSDSFISRLNRLEMDYPRLRSLFSQAYPKLKHYKAEEYDELFAYLGTSEISNLDPKQQVQKDLMNLVFAVGMAFGLTIGPKKEVKS